MDRWTDLGQCFAKEEERLTYSHRGVASGSLPR